MQIPSSFTTKNKSVTSSTSSLNPTRPLAKPATQFQGATGDVFQKRHPASIRDNQSIRFSGKKTDKFIYNALDATQGFISGFAKGIGTSYLAEKWTGGDRKKAEALYEMGMSSLDKKPRHKSKSSHNESSRHYETSSRRHESSRDYDPPRRHESSRRSEDFQRDESSRHHESTSRRHGSSRDHDSARYYESASRWHGSSRDQDSSRHYSSRR